MLKHKRYELHALFNYLTKNNYKFEKLEYSIYEKVLNGLGNNDKTKNIWKITPRMDNLPLYIWLWFFKGQKLEDDAYIYFSVNLEDCTIIKLNANYNYEPFDPYDDSWDVPITDEFSMEEASSDPDLFEYWSEVRSRENDSENIENNSEENYMFNDHLSYDERLSKQMIQNIDNIDNRFFSSFDYHIHACGCHEPSCSNCYDSNGYFISPKPNDININSLSSRSVELLKDLDKEIFYNCWKITKSKEETLYLTLFKHSFKTRLLGDQSDPPKYIPLDYKDKSYQLSFDDYIETRYNRIEFYDNPKLKFEDLSTVNISDTTFSQNFRIKIIKEYEQAFKKVLSSIDDKYTSLINDDALGDYLKTWDTNGDDLVIKPTFFANFGMVKFPFEMVTI